MNIRRPLTAIVAILALIVPATIVVVPAAQAAGSTPTVALTLGKSSTYTGECTYDGKWSTATSLSGSTQWYLVIGNPGRQPYAPQFYVVPTDSQLAKGTVSGTDTTGVLTSSYFGKDPYGVNSPVEVWLVSATSTPALARPTVYAAYSSKVNNRC